MAKKKKVKAKAKTARKKKRASVRNKMIKTSPEIKAA